MSFSPTPAQKAAVETTDQNIILSAGAGSGKTRVLVQRYLYLLEQRLAKVNQILAITFTNKAAGEMKERIMKEVFKRVQNGSPDEKEFWRGVKEDLNQAQISTFHGFCGQVLRQEPMLTEVDPFFTTLDELRSNELLNESIEEIFLNGLEAGDKALITLVKEYGIFAINGLLKNGYLNSRGSGDSLEVIASLSLNRLDENSECLDGLKNEIIDLVESLLIINEQEKLAAGTKAKLQVLKERWLQLKLQVEGIISLNSPERESLSEIKEILKGNVANSVKEHCSRIKEIIDKEIELYLADRRAMELIPALVQVLRLIDQTYTGKKKRVKGLDFSDLEEKTLTALQQNNDLSNLYQNKYKYIMVDEFQDTNQVQEELIRLLIGGRIDSPISGNKLFIVGDPKQSIYKFRGADVTVFKRLQSEIREVGQEIVMDINFRSQGKIIEFVNHFFAQVFGSCDNPYDMEYQRSEYSRDSNRDGSCIEFLILDKTQLEEEEITGREEEADQLALRIQEMVLQSERLVYTPDSTGVERPEPVTYGDICILFQALTNVQIYEEALQRYRVPYTVFNGRGFFERQEIRDLLNLLKIVDNHHREIEWIGVLRSPFCGLSDEDLFWLAGQGEKVSQVAKKPERWDGLSKLAVERLTQFLSILEQARKERDKKELSLLITNLLEETGYLQLMLAHPYGDLIRANLDKLITISRYYEQDTYSSLAGFIKHIEWMEANEAREGMAQIPGQTNRVKLMTIHQSKGLEFPVVILADTQRPLLNPSRFPAICFDSQLGLGVKVKDSQKGGLVRSSLHDLIYEEEKKREIAEWKRVFYVAATRAKDYLLISGQAKEFKAPIIDEGKSWLDWIGTAFQLISADQLPLSLPYGSGDSQIRVRQRLEMVTLEETASVRDFWSLERWQEIYQHCGLNPIEPRGKGSFTELSVTGLLTYKRCPRWYYHRYIQRMPASLVNPLGEPVVPEPLDILTTVFEDTADYEDENVNSIGSEASLFTDSAERGTLIHFLCERIKNIHELPELLKNGLVHLGRADLTSEQVYPQLVAQVKPLMENFLKKEDELRRLWEDEKIQIRDQRELPFNIKLDFAIIRGTIDRLIVTKDMALIIDYKSNQILEDDLKKVGLNYQLQMELYALAVYHLTGRTQIKCKLHFLVPDRYYEFNFRESELDQILEKIKTLTGEIITATQKGVVKGDKGGLQSEFLPSATPENCYYREFCSYYLLCQNSLRST